MSYSGWRTVTIIWLDGTVENVEVLDRPYIKDNVLHIQISYNKKYRHIPLSSIREWQTPEYD